MFCLLVGGFLDLSSKEVVLSCLMQGESGCKLDNK